MAVGIVMALGPRVSASVGGCVWGNFLFVLSKRTRGLCGPRRCQCFPPTEDEVSHGAPLDLVVIFRLLCRLDWGRRVLCLMMAGTPRPWSGTKVSSQSK